MQRWHLQFRKFLSHWPLGKWKVFWEVKPNVCSIFVLLPEHLLGLIQGRVLGQVYFGADHFQSSLCPAFHTRPCISLRGTAEMKPEVSGAPACLPTSGTIFTLKSLPPRPTGRCIPFSFSSQRKILHLHGQGFSAGGQVFLEWNR